MLHGHARKWYDYLWLYIDYILVPVERETGPDTMFRDGGHQTFVVDQNEQLVVGLEEMGYICGYHHLEGIVILPF